MKKSTFLTLIASLFLMVIIFGIILFLLPSPPEQSVSPQQVVPTSKSHIWLSVAVLMLSVTTLISVGISFYLYKWRKILLSRPTLLVPEELGKYLGVLGKEIKSLNNEQQKNLGSVSSSVHKNSEKIENMIETFMTLQKVISEKDIEIKKLRDGYDTQIFKKFLYRFIRIDELFQEIYQDESIDQKDIDTIKELFEEAFRECGVEKYAPELGSDSKKTEGIATPPRKITTSNAEENSKISKIVSEGYRIKLDNRFDYIVPAKVEVMVYRKEEVEA